MSENTEERKEEERWATQKAGDVLVSGRDSRKIGGNFPELGLCSTCAGLQGVVTEFGRKGAHCLYTRTPLNGKHKIVKCSSFWDNTYVHINQLLDMALFLDFKKERPGF
jgi:hypothetical protein